jgi:fluoride exporter
MTPLTLAAVALGGALGSVARYAVGLALRPASPTWPWGTLTVNVAGSLAIGILFAWFAARPVSDAVRLGLITGVLGGFTTFSAFSIETLELLRSVGPGAAAGYVAVSLITGLGACALGLWAARALLA